MLTLEEAIKPILEEEAVDGYGPVCAYEGKYHWFVGFGFDGKMAPGDAPYAIDKETGKIDFFPIPFFLRCESPSAIELEMDKAHEVKIQ